MQIHCVVVTVPLICLPPSLSLPLPLFPFPLRSPFLIEASRNHKAVAESIRKLERDREFLEMVAAGTFKEMGTKGTFDALTSCISECKEEKRNMQNAILR